MNNVSKPSAFKWTKKRDQAAVLLAQGYTFKEAAAEIGTSERQIYRWNTDTAFSAEVDRLSVMVDIASRAERLRIAKRMVRMALSKARPTEKDLLEWLKYVQSETDGANVNISAVLADILTSVAGGGQESPGDEVGAEETEA